MIHNPVTLMRLHEEVGPVIACNFDIAHMWYQGIDPIEAVRYLGPLIQHVHVKDTLIHEYNSRLKGLMDSGTPEHPETRSWTYTLAGWGHDAKTWKVIFGISGFWASFRILDTVGIIDKASGDFTWKWGPGDISHQHNPTFLDNGRVLIFDNGPHKPGFSHSRVIEVDPTTNEIAWEYKGDPPISFYSYHISGAERLPNGNTLITEGAPGRCFEVTPSKEIVWEYVNPHMAPSGRGAGGSTTSLANSVFRVHRYGPDHPALQGKDLDPARYANLNRLYAGG